MHVYPRAWPYEPNCSFHNSNSLMDSGLTDGLMTCVARLKSFSSTGRSCSRAILVISPWYCRVMSRIGNIAASFTNSRMSLAEYPKPWHVSTSIRVSKSVTKHTTCVVYNNAQISAGQISGHLFEIFQDHLRSRVVFGQRNVDPLRLSFVRVNTGTQMRSNTSLPFAVAWPRRGRQVYLWLPTVARDHCSTWPRHRTATKIRFSIVARPRVLRSCDLRAVSQSRR